MIRWMLLAGGSVSVANAPMLATNEAGAAARTTDQIPAHVAESVERLLSKSDSFDITRDLHVLMEFEKPEQGDQEYVSGGSSSTVYYFRRLGITWVTLVDPNGRVRSKFHRSR